MHKDEEHNQIKTEKWKGRGGGGPESPGNCTTYFVTSASRF
jgi:hypothetical protein